MSGKVHVGTSGWNYRDWSGRFYPDGLPQSKWFAHYARAFATVEINNTFYHQPTEAVFDAWRKQAPRNFLYAVKAHRFLTHMKRLNDPEEPLRRVLDGATRLKEHLGPILYQLPPNWKRNQERLETFMAILPTHLTHAIEFRDRDWLCDETYDLLKRYGVGLCIHDLLKRHPRIVTGPIVYMRFHGAGKKYAGKYSRRRLQAWAAWINEVSRDHDVFAYFNNDQNANAVANAIQLRELCTRSVR